ncbi:hypothetical protein CHL67_08290 [Prosthecochloris sp. GSB1]|uniref:alkaline phosphatase n=1 Tax=Prosthecochloris sp. GSB1 TaxID=281093 RepID=UPI000B8CB670|nr:alkaline phosphatase [Prosthecochloris sp. GSB1]ASQ90918.1 hypothetical protein CHL67_08290 [Prosthecochloris sp. GSB1]
MRKNIQHKLEDYFLRERYLPEESQEFLKDSAEYAVPATDSASAGTAIATGYKTDAGNISWASGDPENGELTTIAETLRSEEGFAIGVVSTVPFSHATPAVFVSHDVNRGNKYDIAHEILFETQPDVVIGSGYENSYFARTKTVDENGNDYNDDYDSFVNGTDGTDYVFVQRDEDLDGGDLLMEAANSVDLQAGEKLFGLFGTSGGNFEYYDVDDNPGSPSITRDGDGDGVDEDPTLAEATIAALTVLDQDEDGFFVMIEQGDIDWNNHANDYENMIGSVYDLDQAVRVVEAYVDIEGDDMDWSNTLVIVTSDHSNSYMRTNEELGIGDLPSQEGSPYDFTYPNGEVTYGTTGHTNELVTLQARGAGAELFEEYAGSWYEGTSIVDNTQIYDVMLRAAQEEGVEHVILFIGDGMNVEHEMAASRYLYGDDQSLAWDDWGTEEIGGYAGYSSTWDINTYNRYADEVGAEAYHPVTFNPLVGYNPKRGGEVPYPLESDSFFGHRRGQTIIGSKNDEQLIGDENDNRILGLKGDDVLNGGLGADRLRGGNGSDTFVYESLKDSLVTPGARDVITDFKPGEDLIDLSSLAEFDGVILGAGDHFDYKASGAQLLFDSEAGILYGNVDSDNYSDFAIELIGVDSLEASDFMLVA